MIGTIVNCFAIIIGSFLGILFSRKITEEISDVICSGAGVVTLIIGFQMAFQVNNIIYLALSLILGGILGSWANIDGKILLLGSFLEKRFGRSSPPSSSLEPSKFAYAFLNASVLFCVGAMAIVGSFKAGTEADYTILYTKSVLDGFMAIVFGAAMGIGTAFSAISIFVYQGILTLFSSWVKPFVGEQMISELTALGGAFIIMIGINLLKLRSLKTANYLPAMVIIIIFVILDPIINEITRLFV